jgi:aminocarboxymuconate-semialdehyde decarboxylase
MKVDIHAHVLLPETLGAAGQYGPEVWEEEEGGWMALRVGEHVERARMPEGITLSAMLARFGDPEVRIADMDHKGVDWLGVTISPLFYLYWAEPGIGTKFSQLQNDAMARFVTSHPERLFFLATLPMQDIDASLGECDRAIGELGARGINVGGENLGGRELDDEDFWPLYEKVEHYDVPLFIHPYPHVIVGNQKDDYNLSWITGYPQQETAAITRLIYGGVLDRFPRLKVYVTHGGGFAPYQWGRIEAFAPYMPGVKAQRPIREYLSNFYFDLLLHDVQARRFLVEFMGADNLVFGSNYGSPQDQADFSFLDELGLDEESYQKIAGLNALKLFNLE